MKTKNLAIIMSAVPIAAIGVDQAAVAQATSDKVFEEIVVTAQRREQSIYDVPVAISAFSPETIERQGITDLVDLGKFVPNLNVTGFSAGHTSSANPFIRGIGLQDHLITTVLIEDPNKEVGEMQDISGRIAMLWEPSDRLSFLVTADGNDGDNGLRPYDTLIDELGAACRANPRLPRRPALVLTAPFTMQATAIPIRPAIRTTTTPAR